MMFKVSRVERRHRLSDNALFQSIPYGDIVKSVMTWPNLLTEVYYCVLLTTVHNI